jgi:hypothetical protein
VECSAWIGAGSVTARGHPNGPDCHNYCQLLPIMGRSDSVTSAESASESTRDL